MKFQRTDVKIPESVPGTSGNQEWIRGGVRRGRSERAEAEESKARLVKGREAGAEREKVATGRAGMESDTPGQEEHGAGTTGEWHGLSVSPQQQDLTDPA
ncbi:MAG: hypothetical protein EBV83_06135 [Verrucomicrobia bacterium]|nr:hypothetical protein [Verrucomicrobiota bacterium]